MSSLDIPWIIENRDTGCQRWIQRGARFVEVRVDQQDESIPVQDHCDLDALGFNLRRPCDRSGCAKLFPGTFKFCPFCGNRLRLDNGRESSTDIWWSMRASGFPELSFQLEISGMRRPPAQHPQEPVNARSMELPKGGLFAFMVAGKPPRLYAFDRNSCILWVKGLLSDKWRQLEKLAPAEPLPSWSWAAAESLAGFALVSGKTACWITLPWQSDTSVKSLELLGPDDRLIAGAGYAGSMVAIPLLKGERLAVAWLNTANGVEWQLIDNIPGWNSEDTLTLAGEKSVSKHLSAPVQDIRGSLFWAGETGFLACEVSADKDGLHDIRWLAWPSGHKGRPEFRPSRDIHGSIYQLVLDENKRRSFADKMSMLGHGERHPVNGPFFSAGHDSFYEYYRYPEHPWDDYSEKDIFDTNRQNVFPLFAFGVDAMTSKTPQLFYGSTKTELRDGYRNNREPFPMDVLFRSDTGVITAFRRGFKIQWPTDLAMFYFEDRLCLYDSFGNTLWYWPAEPRL